MMDCWMLLEQLDVVGAYLGHTKSDTVEGKIANRLIEEYEKRAEEHEKRRKK